MRYLYCVIATAIATWFAIGMYELITTFHFSFINLGYDFGAGLIYFSFYLGIFLSILVTGIIAYYVYLYVNKIYELKNNNLLQKNENLIQMQKQELIRLNENINTLVGTKEDIDRTIEFAQNLFTKILNHCNKVIASNEKFRSALQQKYVKQATNALKTGKIDNKSVNKLNKRLKDMTDNINHTINHEKEEFSNLSGLEKQLIEKIKEIGG